jgi:hypothetical protein
VDKGGDMMGERGNIVVDGVYLYTHWKGHKLKSILKSALTRGRSRWDDPPYLARIIFCEMIGNEQDGLTGYGISTSMQDNNHNPLEVDIDKQVVREHKVDYNTYELGLAINEWTFEEFIGS